MYMTFCPDALSTGELQALLEQAQKYGHKLDCPAYTDLLEYLSSADRTATYQVQEILGSGTIITHKDSCSYEEMAWYVKAVFITAVPPRFLIWELDTPAL